MARELERELNSMRAYLEEKESALVKTAELGKALLRENGVLEERLVEANREATQRIEVQVITANSPTNVSNSVCFVQWCRIASIFISLLGNSIPSFSLYLPPSLPPSQELEQERFSLQQRLECQKAALQAVQHETDSVRIELKHEYEMREEHLKQVCLFCMLCVSKCIVYHVCVGASLMHLVLCVCVCVCVCIYVCARPTLRSSTRRSL